MTGTRPSLGELLRLTANDPRRAIVAIKAMELRPAVAWQAFALALVLTLLMIHGLSMLAGTPEPVEGALAPALIGNPVLLGVLQGCIMVLMAFSIHWVGRAFGGTGRLEDAIGSVALLIFAMLVLNVVEFIIITLLPIAAAGVVPFHFVIFFYLLTMFVTELHGFNRPLFVLGGIVLTMVGSMIGLSIMLAILIMVVTGGAPANV